MLKFKRPPFEEDVEKATHENNEAEDWALIMHICDKVVNYEDGSKFCLKAIMKRLNHTVPRVVLHTLTLLDACVKNCDRRFLLQVASSEFTNEVGKLLGKMHPSAAVKFKALIQRWSLEDFKDDSELCIIPALYYTLKSEGVDFQPQEEEKKSTPLCTNPDAVSSQEEENDIIKAIEISLKDTGKYEPRPTLTETSSIMTEPFADKVLYDFEAAEDNELTIKKGELVIVLDNSNAYWWRGRNHRGEGYFPANFVSTDTSNTQKEEEDNPVETVGDSANQEEANEIKLDENKIETLIEWLNDVDPTDDIDDPKEMLSLERECHAMAPFIEDRLESVDQRLALLDEVNQKVMDSFDMFYSLADVVKNKTTMPQNSQMAPMSTPNSVYVPAPSSGSQYIVASDMSRMGPICAVPFLPQPQMANPRPPDMGPQMAPIGMRPPFPAHYGAFLPNQGYVPVEPYFPFSYYYSLPRFPPTTAQPQPEALQAPPTATATNNTEPTLEASQGYSTDLQHLTLDQNAEQLLKSDTSRPFTNSTETSTTTVN